MYYVKQKPTRNMFATLEPTLTCWKRWKKVTRLRHQIIIVTVVLQSKEQCLSGICFWNMLHRISQESSNRAFCQPNTVRASFRSSLDKERTLDCGTQTHDFLRMARDKCTAAVMQNYGGHGAEDFGMPICASIIQYHGLATNLPTVFALNTVASRLCGLNCLSIFRATTASKCSRPGDTM